MIFNSVTFILFFILVSLAYWSLPPRPRYWMLFISSLIFYGFWRWEYLGVMILSAATDYFTAQAIYNTPASKPNVRKAYLAITLIVNLGLLIYFKYLMFFTENFNQLMSSLGSSAHLPYWNIILPFGISFYTFETISYTLDVYRGHIKPEKSFLTYSLFVSFFPKLVAGPIQRASDLMGQLKQRPGFQWTYVAEGVERILFGLFLKVVVADNIAPYVDEVFSIPTNQLSGLDVITMSFLFGFQIYFDFSAYSHIAVGCAKVLGITIPENFNFPYVASSLKDFWKRWHISLSSWIRDYLYLPLTGSKVLVSTSAGGIGKSLSDSGVTQKRKNFALFSTWAIMGLWHGANWTFLLWGLYHAFFIFLERVFKPLRDRWPVFDNKLTGWLFTLPVAMLSWISFRALNLSDALGMYGALFDLKTFFQRGLRENNYLVAGVLMILFLITWLVNEYLNESFLARFRLQWPVLFIKYVVLILLTFVFLRPINQFIYFQF